MREAVGRVLQRSSLARACGSRVENNVARTGACEYHDENHAINIRK